MKKILLEVIPKTNVVPMLWGPRGIGKTRIVHEVAQELGYNVVVLRIGQMEVGDLVGLPEIIDHRTCWARPGWWPGDEDEPVLVFLDEFNRVTERSVVDAMMQFVLDRKLHTHVLAEQHKIVCAGNPPAEGYSVSDLDDAAMSRLLHLYVSNPVEAWMAWAQGPGKINRDIIEFVSVNQCLLAPPDQGEQALKIAPNHRAYEMISEIYEQCDLDDGLMFHVVAGLIGKEAALVFSKFMKERYSRPISASEILFSYPKVRAKLLAQASRQDLLNASVSDVAAYLSDEKRGKDVLKDKEALSNLAAFVKDLPRDLGTGFVSSLMEQQHLETALSKCDELYEYLAAAIQTAEEARGHGA